MRSLKSIEEQWQGFAEMVFDRTPAGATQRAEMKKAFFAGAWSLFCAFEEIGTPAVSEQEGEAFIEAWRRECLAFKSQMIREYSEGN